MPRAWATWHVTTETGVRSSLRALIGLALLIAACSDDTAAGTPDLKMPDLAVYSLCGHPGDVGNSLGVGRFCNKFSDCAVNSQAIVCAVVGVPNEHFCTFMCHPAASDGGSSECGENAMCACQGGQ